MGIGAPGAGEVISMAETANPTTSGLHNHLHAPRQAHDPHSPRKVIDAVFGDEAPIIEGLPIEVGHGCLLLEDQLAEHVKRLWKTEGAEAARAMQDRLLANKTVVPERLEAALAKRGVASLTSKRGNCDDCP